MCEISECSVAARRTCICGQPTRLLEKNDQDLDLTTIKAIYRHGGRRKHEQITRDDIVPRGRVSARLKLERSGRTWGLQCVAARHSGAILCQALCQRPN